MEIMMNEPEKLLLLSQISSEYLQEAATVNESNEGTEVLKKADVFVLARFSTPSPTVEVFIFQQPKESRMKFLLRSPKLWQEFLNSGNLEKLKTLFGDILIDDCLLLPYMCSPIVGSNKIYNLQKSSLENVPDLYVLFSNIQHTKRRLVTMKTRMFGTLTDTKASSSWNFFEHTSQDKMDDYNKTQKEKYDSTKSQKKLVKFESTSTWYLTLNRNMTQITKITTNNVKMEICN